MTRHVVVIGAGPAGLAAATAAVRAGARVTLIDAADQAGGQYHRMPTDAYEEKRPFRIRESERCDWWPGAAVWSLERRDSGPPLVHVVRGSDADGAQRRRYVLRPDALILAPGAHDRVLPFPGWDLPGVVTAGAAQALAKGERVAVGERALVSRHRAVPAAGGRVAAGRGRARHRGTGGEHGRARSCAAGPTVPGSSRDRRARPPNSPRTPRGSPVATSRTGPGGR